MSSEIATLAGGCFWCVEAVFERLEGVSDVVSGYMGGGDEEAPTYEAVCTGQTGHAEVVQVTFDPEKISFSEVLDWFWKSHNPTTLNQQGADTGTQYRSSIFFHSEEQRATAESSMKAMDETGLWPDPAVTEIVPLARFWPAEDYHQDYYRLNGERQPYCMAVITPKLQKLGLDQP